MDSQPSQEVTDLLKQWEEQNVTPNYDPIPTLTRLAEIIEAETENFMKKDPDPFDERHPSRTDPSCALGHALKVMFKKDNFMTKLVNDYVRDTFYSRLNISGRDVRKLNIAACRLTLDLMPGLEMSVVFQDNEGLIHRLYGWAENSVEPLQTYATGLLAAAMEVQDIAAGFREQNARLVPLMLQRLHKLRRKSLQAQTPQQNQPSPQSTTQPQSSNQLQPSSPLADIQKPPSPCNNISSTSSQSCTAQTRHFARFAASQSSGQESKDTPVSRKRTRQNESPSEGGVSDDEPAGRTPVKRNIESFFNNSTSLQEGMMSPPLRGMVRGGQVPKMHSLPPDSASNSSWAEMETYVIGNIQIHPPTDATRQMLILRYLTPMGEYQEFLGHVFSENALELILAYVNLRESRDSRLAFEALKYLAALLCHKKFSIEFINMNGLQRFLEVPRPSVAATGVSICMYYLAYCEDAMERVCLLPRKVLADLVRYALWLLECSHDSGRCHATMFFGFSFQFRVILEEFDYQDGLRKLYNVISTLPILSIEDDSHLTEDESCAARQIVRHVCVALKKYLESHLHHKASALRRQGRPGESFLPQPAYKACKSSPEEIQEEIERLQSAVWTKWAPCDQLLKLGGVTLLLQIIAFSYEWNFNGRAETVRSALDVISACCVSPTAQQLLCEKVDMPEENLTVGVNIVLGAAEGEIVADAEVQKAALNVLVNCVCAPVHRVGGSSARYSSSGSLRKKINTKSYEDIIQKVWECVRTNNGIMVLLQLMLVKVPITDADCLRGLACRALAGLARCPTVRQIISKLPLFTTGQIQSLMRDPILQEKRQEHVMFQKYALELMERVSGKTKKSGKSSAPEFESSLANIHRANVVAQTHITFNERQLYQLIYQHLVHKGLSSAAEALRVEATLAPAQPQLQHPAPPPTVYQPPTTPTRSRISTSRNQPNPVPPESVPPPTPTNTSLVNGIVDDAVVPNGPVVPVTIKIRRCQSVGTSAGTSSSITSTPGGSGMNSGMALTPVAGQRSLQKAQTPHTAPSTSPTPTPRISLDDIITEYLANQHALCMNPMVTCPQFNLFEPHKCPDGSNSRRAPATNLTARLARRQAGLGPASKRLDARLLHSNFYNVRTFRLPDDDSYFTSCLFHPTQQTLLAGTSTGEVKLFNLFTGSEENSYQLLDTYICHMQASREGKLLLASSKNWRQPLSGLWNMKHYEMQLSFNEEEYVEFSKLNEDRVIGTKGEVATVYDTATGRVIITLNPGLSNQYSKNRATFSPTDELVLSDGVLWDLNAGKEIHKFDKLNQSLSGVFHPNGLEIISNTEVWDLRTFHLLRTVPTLDKSEVIFSPMGGIIYSVCMEQDADETSQYESNFKTLDSFDYSSIATIDVKRKIRALGVAPWGGQLALAENVGEFDTIQESVLKLYDVGRRRDHDDEADDEEEEDVGGSDNEGSDTNTDNDDNTMNVEMFRNALAELAFDNENSNEDDDSNDSNSDEDHQDDNHDSDNDGVDAELELLNNDDLLEAPQPANEEQNIENAFNRAFDIIRNAPSDDNDDLDEWLPPRRAPRTRARRARNRAARGRGRRDNNNRRNRPTAALNNEPYLLSDGDLDSLMDDDDDD